MDNISGAFERVYSSFTVMLLISMPDCKKYFLRKISESGSKHDSLDSFNVRK